MKLLIDGIVVKQGAEVADTLMTKYTYGWNFVNFREKTTQVHLIIIIEWPKNTPPPRSPTPPPPPNLGNLDNFTTGVSYSTTLPPLQLNPCTGATFIYYLCDHIFMCTRMGNSAWVLVENSKMGS